MKHLLITFALIALVSASSVLEDSSKKDSLDVSYLPKKIREWHVRINGNGYLRFLVPKSMEMYEDQTDEESFYIHSALHDDPNDPDPYRLKPHALIQPATCVSSDNNPPTIDIRGQHEGNCVTQYASCTHQGVVVNINKTATERPPECIGEISTCQEVSANVFAELQNAPVQTIPWDSSATLPGECIRIYEITLNEIISNVNIGDIFKQNREDDGLITGEIISVDDKTFTLNNVWVQAEVNVPTSDFALNTDYDIHIESAVYKRRVIHQTIRKRTFTPAVLKTFSPYIVRTYTPAIVGGDDFLEVYSRYGLLHVNKYRLLVNVNGLLVIGKTKQGNDGFIHIPQYYNDVIIKQNGKIDVKYTDGTIEYVGRLMLTTFPNHYGLNIWSKSGFEIKCNGAGGFGTSLGSWCSNTGLDGKVIWYYVNTVDSGEPILKNASAFSPVRFQQYHLNSKLKDLYISGSEPKDFY